MRDYDASSSTWTTADSYRGSLAQPSTLHRTCFVHGNPINYFDLYGYAACDKLAADKQFNKEQWEKDNAAYQKDSKRRRNQELARQREDPYHRLVKLPTELSKDAYTWDVWNPIAPNQIYNESGAVSGVKKGDLIPSGTFESQYGVVKNDKSTAFGACGVLTLAAILRVPDANEFFANVYDMGIDPNYQDAGKLQRILKNIDIKSDIIDYTGPHFKSGIGWVNDNSAQELVKILSNGDYIISMVQLDAGDGYLDGTTQHWSAPDAVAIGPTGSLECVHVYNSFNNDSQIYDKNSYDSTWKRAAITGENLVIPQSELLRYRGILDFD